MATSASERRRAGAAVDRRIAYIFGAFLLLLTAVAVRAGYLDLFRGSWLKAQEAEEHVQTQTVPAVRGTITDRNGVVLAVSESTDIVVADPLLIAKAGGQSGSYSADQIASKLAPLVNVPALTLRAKLGESTRGYVVLAKNVSSTQATKVEQLDINGITLEPAVNRLYPRGSEAAQLLGFTNSTDTGLLGVEQQLNKQLAGSSGVERTINDGATKPISMQTVKAMHSGSSVQLTINSALQTEVEQVLAGVGAQYSPKNATAIVMNPSNGQVLAMASWPTFDPNKSLTASEYQNDTVNQAVGLSYEPGSTFKAITVAGALQDGLVTPNTVFHIPPELTYYGKTIQDAENHGYENLTVNGILKVSSNIGADLIGQELGPTRFSYWMHRFGFGTLTGIGLPDEQTGIVPKINTSQWSGLTMANLPFGQGLEVTPIQLITAYSAIADGGILRKPSIIESVGGKQVKQAKGTRIISSTVAAELRNMLRGVFADGGTASGAQISGYDLAGKTGTANVVVDGKYSDSDYMASFVGMVPASDPKLVVAVVVNDPQHEIYGGSVAAPAFQKIVGWAVPYFGINPCPSPCPASAYATATTSTP